MPQFIQLIFSEARAPMACAHVMRAILDPIARIQSLIPVQVLLAQAAALVRTEYALAILGILGPTARHSISAPE
jgi:hypothetical protein